MPLPLIPLIIGGVSLIAGAIGAKKGRLEIPPTRNDHKKWRGT